MDADEKSPRQEPPEAAKPHPAADGPAAQGASEQERRAADARSAADGPRQDADAPDAANAPKGAGPPAPSIGGGPAAAARTDAATEASKSSGPSPSMVGGGANDADSGRSGTIAGSSGRHVPGDQSLSPHRSAEDLTLMSDADAERTIRGKSRRSFLWAAVAVAGAWAGFEWLGSQYTVKGVAWPFRRLFEINEGLSRDLFSRSRLAPQFPLSAARMPRANPPSGMGMSDTIDPDWKLHLVGLADMSEAVTPSAPKEEGGGDQANSASPPPDDKKTPHDKKGGAQPASSDAAASASDQEPAVLVTMDDIRKLPRTEMVTELKCIEGWSTVVHWTGVRLIDFLKRYPPATKSGQPFDPDKLSDLPEFVSMSTPDAAYYVGLDMASALHPQTMLCYEMNGAPLEPNHGAPLRLAIPVKYGIKNIKNVGKIKFTDDRPKDYWAEVGYDWYAGH